MGGQALCGFILGGHIPLYRGIVYIKIINIFSNSILVATFSRCLIAPILRFCRPVCHSLL